MTSKEIIALAENDELMEVGRKAIEEALIDFRERRMSEPIRGNGFVVREADGKASGVIRFGPEIGLRIALKAIARSL